MSSVEEIRKRVIATTRQVFEHLYKIIPEGQMLEYNGDRLAADLGIGRNVTEDRAKLLQELDILRRNVHWGRPDAEGRMRVGRWTEWELLMPYDKAKAVLDEWLSRYAVGEVFVPENFTKTLTRGGKPKDQPAKEVKVSSYRPKMRPDPSTADEDADILAEMGIKPKTVPLNKEAFAEEALSMERIREMKIPPRVEQAVADAALDEVEKKEGAYTAKPSAIKKVAIATKPDEEVRAIAGPDRPSPFAALAPLRKDEPGALVEAARQYANRAGVVHEQVEKLLATAKALGITINPDMLAGGIQLETDERLESIALVLPYIDKLEARVTRLTAELTEMRGKGDLETLRNENRRLKARVEQLVSQRVLATQRTQAQA